MIELAKDKKKDAEKEPVKTEKPVAEKKEQKPAGYSTKEGNAPWN